jgi:hypothetical protein
MAGKHRAQNQMYEEQAPPPEAAPPPPPPAAAPQADTVSQLKELAQLHEQGVLTDQEFAQQKAKLLG